MSHLNDMSEDEITSFVIVDLLGELSEVLACFFFDLSNEKRYVKRVEIEEVDETWDENGFDSLLWLIVFFEVLSKFWDFMQEEPGDVLPVFDLN